MTHTLGIEFGSTRIKAVLIDEAFRPVASGADTRKSDHPAGGWRKSGGFIDGGDGVCGFHDGFPFEKELSG